MTDGTHRRHLMIFGAAGRTGRCLTVSALAAGWRVTAAARRPLAADVGLTPVAVDARDGDAVAASVASARPDGVVWLVGATDDLAVDSVGPRHLVTACQAAAVRRVLLVTSLGCGSSRRFAAPRLIAAIGPILAAKTEGEAALAASDLDWTIVRPAGLTDGPATGHGLLYLGDCLHGRIRRADLADLLLGAIDHPIARRRVVVAVDRSSCTADWMPASVSLE